MRWSKLKHEIESRFCDALKERLAIYSARYGSCHCGHAWITLDKKVIANFCARAFWNTHPVWDDAKNRFAAGNEIWDEKKRAFIAKDEAGAVKEKYAKLLNDYGELSRQDVYQSCWEYLHDLSVEEALLSDNPLIQTLAAADRRMGKRRLKKIDQETLHPLAGKIYEARIAAEAGRNKE